MIRTLEVLYFKFGILFSLQGLLNSLDFIINTASGDIPFDQYLSLLKTGGVLSLVGFPSEVKFLPHNLNLGML